MFCLQKKEPIGTCLFLKTEKAFSKAFFLKKQTVEPSGIRFIGGLGFSSEMTLLFENLSFYITEIAAFYFWTCTPGTQIPTSGNRQPIGAWFCHRKLYSIPRIESGIEVHRCLLLKRNSSSPFQFLKEFLYLSQGESYGHHYIPVLPLLYSPCNTPGNQAEHCNCNRKSESLESVIDLSEFLSPRHWLLIFMTLHDDFRRTASSDWLVRSRSKLGGMLLESGNILWRFYLARDRSFELIDNIAECVKILGY